MKHIKTPQHVQGFVLIEVMIAMFIFAMMATYAMYDIKTANQAEQGRLLAGKYLTINQAVGNYMVEHYDQLKELNRDCGVSPFSPEVSDLSDYRSACSLSWKDKNQTFSFVNGLQPTVAELISAKYMQPDNTSKNLVITPDMPADSGMKDYTKNAAAPYQLFVNIELVCLSSSYSDPTATTDPQTGYDTATRKCPSGSTTAFRSLVFNTSSYASGGKGFITRMAALKSALGADGAMSNINTNDKLVGDFLVTQKNEQIKNPVRNDNNQGWWGIVAMVNGYGAAYTQSHTRRDGSNPPTNDWSFANHDITDVTRLEANKLKLGGATVADAKSCDPKIENMSYVAGENGKPDQIYSCQKVSSSEAGKVSTAYSWRLYKPSGALNTNEYEEIAIWSTFDANKTFKFEYQSYKMAKGEYTVVNNVVNWKFDQGVFNRSVWLETPYFINQFVPVIIEDVNTFDSGYLLSARGKSLRIAPGGKENNVFKVELDPLVARTHFTNTGYSSAFRIAYNAKADFNLDHDKGSGDHEGQTIRVRVRFYRINP